LTKSHRTGSLSHKELYKINLNRIYLYLKLLLILIYDQKGRIELSSEQPFTHTISHKDLAVTFLQLIVSGKIREAYEKYIGPNFCHHNPFFRGDAESLMLAMEENEAISPNKILDVKHAIQEGDTVVVHSHIKQNHDDLGAAVIHIFRFENNQVVELWDVGQEIPKDSPNENGMF
jgi:predicted SnoaL-like aldol condensation-catalyzing enzyme